jgi:ankyrin repeat protein
LQELANIITSKELKSCPNDNVSVSKESDRLVWEASAILSDSRPPSNFCVYNKEGVSTPPVGGEQIPPIFDGSVANATPPPLGGTAVGASGGAGTILHLACAMDQPFLLALFLCMGADGRASHTAFRRLMIHEAACNGSINCLRLLLEMGQKYSQEAGSRPQEAGVPFFPDNFELPPATTFPGSNTARTPPAIGMNIRHFRRGSNGQRKGDFLGLLRQFQYCCESLKRGKMTELQAARSLLEDALLLDTTRTSLIRSCAFKNGIFTTRTFLRPNGCADGHGNTPLHWAAFKNETECVSLLLQYDANPNARAHPSGWTPLHDAAYSDSSESIGLLINKGAQVDARANSGATPLCFAAQEDAANAAQLLLQRGADLTARCAGAPQEDGIQQAQAQAYGPNHPHSRFSGYTPLHYCAHYNAHCAAKVLLKHRAAKAAMETADLSSRLPIHVAVARGSSDVLRELLHAGARVDIRPGNSPRSPPVTFFSAIPEPPPARRPPSPEEPVSPNRARARTASNSSPVTSPVLRSMIPSQPITSSKPWNCLSQQAIDECKELISKAELSWSPDRHLLFTPPDRKAIMELLRVGKRLEQNGTGIFIDLWPLVLSFCGRGWFEVETSKPVAIEYAVDERSVEESDDAYVTYDSDVSIEEGDHNENCLSLPSFGSS